MNSLYPKILEIKQIVDEQTENEISTDSHLLKNLKFAAIISCKKKYGILYGCLQDSVILDMSCYSLSEIFIPETSNDVLLSLLGKLKIIVSLL